MISHDTGSAGQAYLEGLASAAERSSKDARDDIDCRGGARLVAVAGPKNRTVLFVLCADRSLCYLDANALASGARTPSRWAATCWHAHKVLLPELVAWRDDGGLDTGSALAAMCRAVLDSGRGHFQLFGDGSFNPGLGSSGFGIVARSGADDIASLSFSLGTACLSPVRCELAALVFCEQLAAAVRSADRTVRLELYSDAASLKAPSMAVRYVRGSTNPAHSAAILATRFPGGTFDIDGNWRDQARRLKSLPVPWAVHHVDLAGPGGYRRLATIRRYEGSTDCSALPGLTTSHCLKELARLARGDETLATGICGVPADMARAAGFRLGRGA